MEKKTTGRLKSILIRIQSFLLRGVAVLAIPTAVVALFYTLEQQGFFRIENVDIQVQAEASQKILIVKDLELIQKDLDALKDISLTRVELKDIQLDLKKYPWIETFRITKAWPRNLSVEIIPYEVSMVIQSGTKHFTPVTENGELLKPIPLTDLPDVVMAPQKSLLNNKEKRMQALQFVNSMPAKGTLSRTTISSIDYNDRNGFELRLIEPAIRVILGENDLQDKAKKVSQVLEYIEKNQIKVKAIDANSTKKIIVRMQDGQTGEIVK